MKPGGIHDLQAAVFDLVAPPNWREMHITAAELRLEVKQAPRLTLECLVFQPQAEPQRIARRYTLHEAADPQQRPGLDLHAMEQAARERVRTTVNRLARGHQEELTTLFRIARMDAQARHDQLVWEVAASRRTSPGGPHRCRGWVFAGHAGPEVCGPGRIKGSAMHYLLTPLAGALVLALTLGTFGPSLDSMPDRRAEFSAAEQELINSDMWDRWAAMARQKCEALGGDNAGWIVSDRGVITCTDKRGRRLTRKERP